MNKKKRKGGYFQARYAWENGGAIVLIVSLLLWAWSGQFCFFFFLSSLSLSLYSGFFVWIFFSAFVAVAGHLMPAKKEEVFPSQGKVDQVPTHGESRPCRKKEEREGGRWVCHVCDRTKWTIDCLLALKIIINFTLHSSSGVRSRCLQSLGRYGKRSN